MSTKKVICSAVLAILSGTTFAQDGSTNKGNISIPSMPESVPGQCYALVNIPAKLSSNIEKIKIQDTGKTIDVVPAKYEWVDKKVIVTEEQKSYEIVPAEFETVKEKVLVEPEKKETKVIPAKYEEITETVLVKPAVQVWRRADGGAASLSGEVMRLIEQPAEYKTVTVKKMIEPARVEYNIIPAEYAEIEKKVVSKPASMREIIIPAEYKTVRVKELVEDVREQEKDIPAEFLDITRQNIVEKAKLNWQRIPCESDLTEDNLKKMQRALRQAGYEITVDGKFGRGSIDALRDYQKKKGLAMGAITIETMRAMGINIK